MKQNLTLKQRAFVAKYIDNNGNGLQAALDSYDTINNEVAKSIASENLTKPYIKQSIQDILDSRGLNLSVISENLKKIANSSPDKPLSGTEVIKANEVLLRLHGAYPRTGSGSSTLNLSQRLESLTIGELKIEAKRSGKESNELLSEVT